MKTLAVVAAWLVWALGIADVAEAHRVNIFAYVDGDVIRVECGFSRGRKVRQGSIEVFDNATGERLLQGTTDDAGIFVFPVPQGARAAGHDLRIGINAGQGHQNEWLIAADEMAATPFSAAPSAVADAPAASVTTAAAPATRSGIAPSSPSLTRADVQAAVNEALDAKLAPIKHMLASQFDAGPSLKDIVGGIGWIFGLVGVAAWFRRRG